MAHHKVDLPGKVCRICNRPFVWRKKWARCWHDVQYCSERCRYQARRDKPDQHQQDEA